MNDLRTVLASTAAVLTAVLALAAPASANQLAPAGDGYGVQADGKLHAYRNINFNTECGAWAGNSTRWPDGCRNQASSVWNNGYPATFDDVNLYWGSGYTGAWACIGRGNYWADLPQGIERFTHGADQPGYWELVNDNVASHRWVSTCSQ